MKKFPLGFIDRKGRFYPTSFGNHTDLAYSILEKAGYEVTYSLEEDPEDYLLARGWIKTYFEFRGHQKEYAAIYVSSLSPTKAQKDFIIELVSDFNPILNETLKRFLL